MRKVTGTLKPLHDGVLAINMNFDEQVSKGGIVILSDDGKTEGVKSRWCQVWAIGPEQHDVKVGDWILVEHGRWTRGITYVDKDGNDIIIRRIETKSIIAWADEKPSDLAFGAFSGAVTEATFKPEMFINPSY